MKGRVRIFARLAGVAAAVGAIYSVLSLMGSLFLRAGSTVPSEGTLRWVTWQYQLSTGAFASAARWMTPPLLVVGLLVAAMFLLDNVTKGTIGPLRKAQGKVVKVSMPDPGTRERMRTELHAAGYDSLASPSGRVCLLVGGLLAGLAGVVSLVLPVQDGFTRGYGPVVCAIAGVVTLLAMVAATPWQRWPQVVLMGDGRLTVNGVEPLAPIVAFPGPTTAGAAAGYPAGAPPASVPPPPRAAPPPPPSPPPPPPVAQAS